MLSVSLDCNQIFLNRNKNFSNICQVSPSDFIAQLVSGLSLKGRSLNSNPAFIFLSFFVCSFSNSSLPARILVNLIYQTYIVFLHNAVRYKWCSILSQTNQKHLWNFKQTCYASCSKIQLFVKFTRLTF